MTNCVHSSLETASMKFNAECCTESLCNLAQIFITAPTTTSTTSTANMTSTTTTTTVVTTSGTKTNVTTLVNTTRSSATMCKPVLLFPLLFVTLYLF